MRVSLALRVCGKVMVVVSFEKRLILDEYYYRNWSFWLDVTLLYKTVKQVLYGRGAV